MTTTGEPNFSQQMIAQMAAQKPAPLAYELLAKYGQPFPHLAPDRPRRGPPGQCFANAAGMSGKNRLTYCEGYAVKGQLLIPLAHAWCVDDDDLVYDPTWEDGGHYFGVRVHFDSLHEVRRLTGRHSLFQCLYLLRMHPDAVRELLLGAIVGAR